MAWSVNNLVSENLLGFLSTIFSPSRTFLTELVSAQYVSSNPCACGPNSTLKVGTPLVLLPDKSHLPAIPVLYPNGLRSSGMVTSFSDIAG